MTPSFFKGTILTMDRQFIYKIDESNSNISIQAFLKSKGFSSANITALKKMPNNTLVNGIWVHMTELLSYGDTLMVNVSETSSSEKIPPVELPLDIVYEDEDIIVINKSFDMPIHPSLNHYENSLANALAYYFEVEQGKPFIFRCANRLDKNTSGLTVVAKNMVSGNILSTMVKNREFHREYRAIVRGYLDKKEGTIDAPIGRVDSSIITRKIDFEAGERAITHYKVVQESNGHSLISVKLETGRTHQIRVHFKYIGYPLIGDGLYNPDFEYMTRQALHSYRISFNHPISGKPMEFVAPLPEDMASVLK